MGMNLFGRFKPSFKAVSNPSFKPQFQMSSPSFKGNANTQFQAARAENGPFQGSASRVSFKGQFQGARENWTLQAPFKKSHPYTCICTYTCGCVHLLLCKKEQT